MNFIIISHPNHKAIEGNEQELSKNKCRGAIYKLS